MLVTVDLNVLFPLIAAISALVGLAIILLTWLFNPSRLIILGMVASILSTLSAYVSIIITSLSDPGALPGHIVCFLIGLTTLVINAVLLGKHILRK